MFLQYDFSEKWPLEGYLRLMRLNWEPLSDLRP